MKGITIATTILIFTHLPVVSQQLFTRKYSVVEGLPSSAIFDITQDSVGMLWCATNKGIASFDGVNWNNYNNITGHLGWGHRFVKCDFQGNLWTVYNHERIIVSVYRDKAWSVYVDEPSPLRSIVLVSFEVFRENGETVIAAGASYAGMVIREKGKWKHLVHGRDLPGRCITHMSQHNGVLYISTDSGICTYSHGKIDRKPGWNSQLPSPRVLSSRYVNYTNTGKAGDILWVLGENWLGYFSGERFNLVTRQFFLIADDPLTTGIICPVSNGDVYFGNRLRLFHISSNNVVPHKLGREEGLIGEGAFTFFQDREKNIWVGSSRGLTCIPFSKFTTFNTNDGIPDNEVSCGMEISPGKCVFGLDAALAWYDGENFETQSLDKDNLRIPHEQRVQDICLDHDKNLWVACSYEGLAKVSPSRKVTWYTPLFFPDDRIVTVAETPDQKILVGSHSGLFILDNGKVSPLLSNNSQVKGVRKIFYDRNNRLFIATFGNGLYLIEGERITQYFNKENRQANNIFSFLHDSKGNYWVGTIDGLYQITSRGYHRSETINIPLERATYLIMEDRRGMLWFGTDDGIFRWNGKMLQHFTVRDGVSGPDVNRDAGFIDSYNRIWFGTNQGITRIHHNFDQVLDQIPPPRVFLDSLKTQSGNFPLSSDVLLANNQNNLEFLFTSVSFLDVKNLKFSCKLEPFDEKWSPEMNVMNRAYRYHNLPPGKYRFHIKVKNSLGTWSDVVLSPVIQIKYPVYLQWWFILLILLTLTYLGYIIFKYIIYRRYNIRLAETVSQRTQELQESERQLMQSNRAKDRFLSIIGHDLRSPFNVILGYLDLLTDKSFVFTPAEREDILDKLKQTAHKTLSLLDNLLSWARTQKGEQKAQITSIDLCEIIGENVILAESMATAKKIKLVNHCRQSFHALGDKNMIHTVVRNLISNAIKFSYQGGTIEIGITSDKDHLITVSIKDHGCGISPENQARLFNSEDHFATKGTNKESGTGLGLLLCMEFIRLNNGKLWMESEQGKGSTFYFSLRSDDY